MGMTPACVIGVGGASGTGKTTLIERALPELKRQGLAVGVVKHAHHGLTVDRRGKDTDRFYLAGADYVFAQDNEQGFLRFPCPMGALSDALVLLPRGLDLVLVEGHKGADVARIRIEKGRGRGRAASAAHYTLYREDPACLDRFLSVISALLAEWQLRRRVCAGLLIGGRSRRMGRPKGLLRAGGRTLMERSIGTLAAVAQQTVLLGPGDLPASLGHAARLPDAYGVSGPLAGILAAFRWQPDSAWIISAVDMPFMSVDAWQWLRGQRRPGAWAIMPRISGKTKVETAAALYEPMIFDHVESVAQRGITALQAIADHPKVITPVIPAELAQAWRNVNTAEEWKRSARELRCL